MVRQTCIQVANILEKSIRMEKKIFLLNITEQRVWDLLSGPFSSETHKAEPFGIGLFSAH